MFCIFLSSAFAFGSRYHFHMMYKGRRRSSYYIMFSNDGSSIITKVSLPIPAFQVQSPYSGDDKGDAPLSWHKNLPVAIVACIRDRLFKEKETKPQ